MKNLFLLPTEKPSRISLHTTGLYNLACELYENSTNFSNRHIYITSNEEIKAGDYRLNIQRDYFKKSDKEGLDYYNKRNDVFKKIILTTDQDLIADGIQAMDDTFLELFVKNPNCESVEVGYGWIRLTETNNEGYWVSIPDNQFEMQQEEPNQETLEEAAFRLYPRLINDPYNPMEDDNKENRDIWINGAKWQAERNYSEEETIQLLIKFNQEIQEVENVRDWFKQFKKK
jgi:hypothetical protein